MEDTIRNNSNVSSQISRRKSSYADNVEFWRALTDIHQALIDIQIAITNLQNWVLKWQISLNILKATYILLYSKDKKLIHPQYHK